MTRISTASETAQQVKAPTAKPDSLSLISRTHMAGGKICLLKVVL